MSNAPPGLPGSPTIAPGSRRIAVAVSFAVLVGVLAIPAFLMPSDTPDWPAFYVAGRLVGTPGLYSFSASHALTKEFADKNFVWAVLRPPFYAAVLAPWSRLDSTHAWVAWQIAGLAAIAAATWLVWPSPLAVPIVLLFHPLWTAFRQGQDIAFVVIALAGSMRLLERKRVAAAGALLAICSIKPHLFLLLPVAVLAIRAWPLLLGAAVCGLELFLVSLVLQGPRWPAELWTAAAVNQSRISGCWSFASMFPDNWAPFILAAVAVAAYSVCRRLEPPGAIAAAAAAGLLVAPRLYAYDVVIVLPLLLICFRNYFGRGAGEVFAGGVAGRGELSGRFF